MLFINGILPIIILIILRNYTPLYILSSAMKIDMLFLLSRISDTTKYIEYEMTGNRNENFHLKNSSISFQTQCLNSG